MTEDKLKDYKSKRDFSKTTEPHESGKGSHGKPVFVIQKHQVRCFFRDIGPGDAHCNPDIGFPKGWSVIDAIPGHGHGRVPG